MDQLNPGQRKCFDAIMKGNNVCVLGAAGTGKSFLIEHVIKEIEKGKKTYQILAPTGISAVNVNGRTLHSYFRIGVGVYTYDDYPHSTLFRNAPSGKHKVGVFNPNSVPDIFIIDEISMVHPEIFQLASDIVKNSTDVTLDDMLPFGGRQVIVLGDFFQLPYVDTRAKRRQCTVKIFQTKLWRNLDFSVHVLRQIVRQNEASFIKALQCIRQGVPKESVVYELLKKCEKRQPVYPDYVKLYARNKDIDIENKRNLDQIDGETFEFESSDWAENMDFRRELDSMVARKTLCLKKSCRVMLIRNLHDHGLVNGSLGTVEDITLDCVSVRFDDYPNSVTDIKKENFQICTFEFLNGQKHETVRARRFQFPLVLAYAISIHKSQGMTIPKLYVDLNKVFAFGQVYTALSRAKDTDNLVITGFSEKAIIRDEDIISFYKSLKSS